jgi:hypothetical protein
LKPPGTNESDALAGVAERCVAEIVAERDRLGQLLGRRSTWR